MQQTLVWKPRHTPGVETLRLTQDARGIHASSHLMQAVRGNSIVANYLLDCDPQWSARRLWLKVDNQGPRSLSLQRDRLGNWLLDGEPRSDLHGCQQIVLSCSPFTHTPTLQRCALQVGQSETLQVAYVDMLGLKVEARQQHYRCLQRRAGEHLYRSQIEGLASEELSVDAQALLLNTSDHYLRMSQREFRVCSLV